MQKLAIVTSHPIQYNAPFFRLLKDRRNIEFKVFYTWSQSVKGPNFDPGFGKAIEWDIPLLDGYDYTFIKNESPKPGTHHFRGLKNPSLNKEIEDWKPDCLLIYGWSFQSHLSCIKYFHKKVPILFRGDSTLLAEHFGLKKIFRTFFLKWVYKHIDYAIYVGENNKQYYLRHGVKEHQLFFAPHAIDNERFIDNNNFYETQADEWKEKLGITKDDLVFLFAGKLETKKNPQLLINAFLTVNAPNAKLVILGNGEIEKELKKKYSKKLNIHFVDFQNQSVMPVVYRLCDVFILPSKGPVETWGLSINEAMACSKAVLVSRVCGCAIDLIQEDVNGYVFNSDNKKYLVEKMKKMLENKHRLKEMGNQSFKIIQNWSFEKICEKVEQLVMLDNKYKKINKTQE